MGCKHNVGADASMSGSACQHDPHFPDISSNANIIPTNHAFICNIVTVVVEIYSLAHLMAE